MLAEIRVGPVVASDGTVQPARAAKTGEILTSDVHGRFYEAAIRGQIYSAGMTALTSISAATFTVATTGNTATPIIGVYNPPGSGKNLVILQARLQAAITALTATGAGAFIWMVGAASGASTTGVLPRSRNTLSSAGSVAKDVSGVALTGITVTLAAFDASGLSGGPTINASTLQTAAGLSPTLAASTDNIDGALIIPPGFVLSLQCSTTPVAVSAVSNLLWEEVSI